MNDLAKRFGLSVVAILFSLAGRSTAHAQPEPPLRQRKIRKKTKNRKKKKKKGMKQ